jgi:hypothetical protein
LTKTDNIIEYRELHSSRNRALLLDDKWMKDLQAVLDHPAIGIIGT